MGNRRGMSDAGEETGKRQTIDAKAYSFVWIQIMAKDMRPQSVAIRSRSSIEFLLFVAKTRQKDFGSIEPLCQAIFSPSSHHAGLMTVMMTILPASSRALSVVAMTLPPNSASASANASFTSRSVSR